MHEFGLVGGVVEAALNRAGERRIARLKVRVGSRHQVVEDAMAQAFEMSTVGTSAEGAVLDLVVVPATTRCRDCAREGDAGDVIPVCPHCGSLEVDVVGGDELILEELEYSSDDGGGL